MKYRNIVLLSVLVLVAIAVFAQPVEAQFFDRVGQALSNFGNSISNSWNDIKGTVLKPFFWVNSVVVFLLLFIASFFIKGVNNLKGGQRAALVIMLVIVSIAIGISVNDKWIWDVKDFWDLYFHVKVIVNIIIMGAFLGLLYGILIHPRVPNAKTVTAVFASILIIFLTFNATTSSIRDAGTYDDTKYKYLWEWENIAPWRLYLFGDSRCYATDGFGTTDRGKGLTSGLKGHENHIKARDGEVYYQNEGTWCHYDNDWNLGWFQFDECNLDAAAKQTLDQDLALATPGDKTESQVNQIRQIEKNYFGKSNLGRYCYTDESLQSLLEGKSLSSGSDYTISEEDIEGFGILVGGRIMITVFAFLMLWWLLTSFNIGQDFKALNWIIALIISASISHSGIGLTSFVRWIAEPIFGFMLYRGMSKEGGIERKWIAAGVAIVLTEWIFSTAFPDKSLFIPIVSNAGPAGKVIFIALLGLGGIWGVGKTTRSTVMADLKNSILSLIPRMGKKIPGIKWLIYWSGQQERTSERNIPKAFRDLLEVTAIMSNWALRLEVWIAKSGALGAKKAGARDVATRIYKAVGYEPTASMLFKKMEMYRHNPTWVDTGKPDSTIGESDTNIVRPLPPDHPNHVYYHQAANWYEPALKNPIKSITDSQFQTSALDGWLLVANALEGYAAALANIEKLGQPSEQDAKIVVEGIMNTHVIQKFEETKADMETRKGSFVAYWKKMGEHTELLTNWKSILSSYTMHGTSYEHTMKIARPTATMKLYKWTLNEFGQIIILDRNQTASLLTKAQSDAIEQAQASNPPRPVDTKIEADVAVDGDPTLPHETTFDGTFTEDTNQVREAKERGFTPTEIIDKLTNPASTHDINVPNYIRKVDPYDVVDHEVYSGIATWLWHAWLAAIEDFRFGKHHPKSMTIQDYQKAYDASFSEVKKMQVLNPLFNYERIPKTEGKPDEGNPAFDMFALACEPDLKYRGRINYWDLKTAMANEPVTPQPTLSSAGLSRFFKWYAEKIEGDPDKRKMIIESFARDTGEAGKRILERIYKDAKKE